MMLRLVTLAALFSVGFGIHAVLLDNNNFDDVVFKEGKSAFVKFYAPWCGHCRAMAITWNRLGSVYIDSNVVIGDIDATTNTEIALKYNVESYPTLLYFKEGNPVPEVYDGGRSLEELEVFVDKHLHIKCQIDNVDGCTDKEKAFIRRIESGALHDFHHDYERLAKQNPMSLKPILRGWRAQRMHILSQFLEKERLRFAEKHAEFSRVKEAERAAEREAKGKAEAQEAQEQ